jgi:hypothetical protein
MRLGVFRKIQTREDGRHSSAKEGQDICAIWKIRGVNRSKCGFSCHGIIARRELLVREYFFNSAGVIQLRQLQNVCTAEKYSIFHCPRIYMERFIFTVVVLFTISGHNFPKKLYPQAFFAFNKCLIKFLGRILQP